MLLYDMSTLHGIVRHLFYLVFAAAAVVSCVQLFNAPPPPASAPRAAGLLPLLTPAIVVVLVVGAALWTGVGLNSNLEMKDGSLFIHGGGCWQSMRGERLQDIWKLLSPRHYYTMQTPIHFGMGHFRPLSWFLLWIVPGSIVMVTAGAMLVHAFNAVGLGLLARRWGADAWIAAAAGSLFAVHPLAWQSLSNTDDLHYAQGMAFVVAALWCYDRFARQGKTAMLVAAAVLFGLSCLVIESFLGASVFFILLAFVFLRTGRFTKRQALRGVAVFGIVTLLLAGTLLFIETSYAPENRLGMLHVTLQHLALTTFFEPQFGFFHPLEAGWITPALRLISVPLGVLLGFVCLSWWTSYSGAAWLSSSFMLGPALTFFEVTSGAWSGGRLAYGPVWLLCLALAMVVPPVSSSIRFVRWALFLGALSACLITFQRFSL